MAEEELAGFRERHRPWPAGALQQPGTHEPLERGDLLRDRRLGVAQRLGRAAERPLARDSLEGCEVPELDSEPLIVTANRTHRESDLSLSNAETKLSAMGYVILLFILTVGVLSIQYGADSRLDEVARRKYFGRSYR